MGVVKVYINWEREKKRAVKGEGYRREVRGWRVKEKNTGEVVTEMEGKRLRMIMKRREVWELGRKRKWVVRRVLRGRRQWKNV